MNAAPASPSIIVGIIPGKAAAVVPCAADFAERFGAELICAFVEAASALVSPVPDATFVAAPLAPDVIEEIADAAGAQLTDEVGPLLRHRNVSWRAIGMVGDPARTLAELADEHNALMIVVGTREGWRGTIHEFFNGSVAARLSHWQHRPVVVVPLDPVEPGGTLPWNQNGEATPE